MNDMKRPELSEGSQPMKLELSDGVCLTLENFVLKEQILMQQQANLETQWREFQRGLLLDRERRVGLGAKPSGRVARVVRELPGERGPGHVEMVEQGKPLSLTELPVSQQLENQNLVLKIEIVSQQIHNLHLERGSFERKTFSQVMGAGRVEIDLPNRVALFFTNP